MKTNKKLRVIDQWGRLETDDSGATQHEILTTYRYTKENDNFDIIDVYAVSKVFRAGTGGN